MKIVKTWINKLQKFLTKYNALLPLIEAIRALFKSK